MPVRGQEAFAAKVIAPKQLVAIKAICPLIFL
jgi:hypothetical protein